MVTEKAVSCQFTEQELRTLLCANWHVASIDRDERQTPEFHRDLDAKLGIMLERIEMGLGDIDTIPLRCNAVQALETAVEAWLECRRFPITTVNVIVAIDAIARR